MTKDEFITKGNELLKYSKLIYVGSVDETGFPNIKCMFNLSNENINKIILSTNTSSKRVKQYIKNNKACIYLCDDAKFQAINLTGFIEICSDYASRKALWREGFEMYYPQGINDPDYSVLKFTAKAGNIYSNLSNETFDL